MEKKDPVLPQIERKSALAGAACGPIQMFDPVLDSLGYSHGFTAALAAAGIIEVTQ
jgi:hypothetical protein